MDPPHGGADPGAVYEGRQEKDDNLRLALAVGRLLEQRGINVVFTRTEDIYQTPFEKATAANQADADFVVSIHRNSSPQSNQYFGAETLVYDKSGTKLELAETINEELEEAGYRNLGVKERPGLVILRRTKAPAVLVEVGFINSDSDNQVFDRNFEEIAAGIANGIVRTLDAQGMAGEQAEAQNAEPEPDSYRVQTGAFTQPEYADDMLYRLQSQGFPASIQKDGEYYKVQVGSFSQLSNAVRMEQVLRRHGYSTFITT